MRILLCAVGAIAAFVLVACGSGSSSTTPANVRLVNTTASAVSLTLSGAYGLSNVASDSASGYEQITPGVYGVSVSSADASLHGGQAVNWPFGTAENYSVIAFQRGSDVYGFPLTDNLTVPAGSYFTLDVANVSPDAGALDVYLLPPGTTSVQNQTATFFSAESLTTTTPATLIPGSYNVIVTGAGNQNDVRISLIGNGGAGAVTFSQSQVATLAFTDTAGGLLVNAFVITQGGSVSAFPATQARVRVMSAVPSGDEVLVAVDGTNLNPVYNFVPSQYALVNAGAGTGVTGVTVSGTLAITPPAGTLTPGQDYTILVYGDGATLAGTFAELLPDSNLVIQNYASMRVINGAYTGAGGVSLIVNSKQVTSAPVLYGAASGYVGATPMSSASVELIGSSYNQIALPNPTNLVSGAVYTVFLYSTTSPPQIIEDR